MKRKGLNQHQQQFLTDTNLSKGWLQRAAVREVPGKEVESPFAGESGLNRSFVNVPVRGGGLPVVQRKLTIGKVGDKYEQEADRVAHQVVQQINTSAPTQLPQGHSLQTKPEIKSLQRQEAIAGGEASADLTSVINSERVSGQALAPGLQTQMGQVMAADFSRVRVHTDAQSDKLNQSLQARAFTTGQDVFFRQGEYQPGSRRGQELIAHELTHVMQQNARAVQRQSPFPLQQYQEHTATETPSDFDGERVLQEKGGVTGDKHTNSEDLCFKTTGLAERHKTGKEKILGDSRNKVRVQNTAKNDVVQPLWVKTAPQENRYMWDTILGAFRWYFNSDAETMYFKIEKPGDLAPEENERLKSFENTEFSFDEWIKAGWLEANIDEGDNATITSSSHKLKRAVGKIKQLIDMGVITTDPATKGIAPKYWGEALDPAHRPVEGPDSQTDLRKKYEAEDSSTHLRMNFYDWLTEKNILIGDQVKYMDEGMRAEYEIQINGTEATRKSSERPLKMDNAFVLSSDGRMYAEQKETRQRYERIHHSSFLAGASVACAGKIFIQKGSHIFYVKDYSGHYQPGVAELKRLKNYLINKEGGKIQLRKENGIKYQGPIQDWSEE